MEDVYKLVEAESANMEGPEEEEEDDPECNNLHHSLLKRNRTLSSSPLAIVGAKVSYIESLDYEINENDLFKQDWRSRSRVQVLQYIFLKWLLAFLVGLLTGGIATLINLAVENITGYKLLAVVRYIEQERYLMGFLYMAGANFLLTLVAAVLVVCFAPTAAGPGIPEIKAYLNGVDTPNMFGASTLIVKIIGSIGAVSAGLDLGKEGPLVHIGSCIASLLGQGGPDNYRIRWRWLRYFNNDRDRRDLITCGSSSGVCAAFRAPVGGVLFALEEVATWWRSALLWRTFFSTAVVVVVLRAVMEYCKSGNCGLFGKGGLIMFDVSGVSVRYHVVDIIPVAVIGVLGGLLGSLYNYVLHQVLKVYNVINKKGKLHKLLLSLSVSIFTSVCLYGLPFLAKCRPCDSSLADSSCPTNGREGNFKQFNCPNGYYNDLATLLLTTNDDAVRNIFSINTSSEFNVFSLVVFFALYCILGLITFGIAVPSGLFLPIILMGSAYGRLLGLAMGPYTNIDQGLYAVLGAASLMAGSMRMTVSLCVIFLELTNNLLLLPITMLQERRRTEEWEVREKFTSIDLAERGATIEEVTVTKDEMEMYVDLHPLTNTTPYTVVESMSVAKAMVLFRQVGLRHMLILPKYQAAGVSPVVGILTRQDLIAHNILSAFPHLERSKANKKGH
ncbi:UNVERIFIED_CONTAM: Chloride channel protein CLC-a [Sesamum radiatum]|uniref:Chloride channel protein n=1 Tax=Sesamum radiatum TaxID=300843 RepID=A0AAW2RAU2_SESRA